MTTYGTSLAALADPTRRSIVEFLVERPRAVGELAAVLPVSRPAVSQHLRVLKEAGLVKDRAVGARRLYEFNFEGLEALRDYLDGFWDRAMAAYSTAVNQGGGEHGQGQ